MVSLPITLMSPSLNGKLGQSPKRINVSGTPWLTNHEFQNFTFLMWEKCDVYSGPDNAYKKRSSLHLSKLYFQQSH